MQEIKNQDFVFFYKFIKYNNNFNDLWRMKSITRECIKEWLISAQVDFIVSENCANACSELIENCIKYGKENELSYIYIKIKNKDIFIETFNFCSKENKDNLIKIITQINSKNINLTDLYIERVKKSIESGVSQLGLIKIVMETNGKIELKDYEDDTKVSLILKINF